MVRLRWKGNPKNWPLSNLEMWDKFCTFSSRFKNAFQAGANNVVLLCYASAFSLRFKNASQARANNVFLLFYIPNSKHCLSRVEVYNYKINKTNSYINGPSVFWPLIWQNAILTTSQYMCLCFFDKSLRSQLLLTRAITLGRMSLLTNILNFPCQFEIFCELQNTLE